MAAVVVTRCCAVTAVSHVHCPLLSSLKTENLLPIAIHQTSDFKLQTMPETRQAALAKRNLKSERMKDLIGIGIMGHWSHWTKKFQTRQNQNNKVEFEGTSDITDHCLCLADSIVSIDTSQFQMLKSQDSR